MGLVWDLEKPHLAREMRKECPPARVESGLFAVILPTSLGDYEYAGAHINVMDGSAGTVTATQTIASGQIMFFPRNQFCEAIVRKTLAAIHNALDIFPHH